MPKTISNLLISNLLISISAATVRCSRYTLHQIVREHS